MRVQQNKLEIGYFQNQINCRQIKIIMQPNAKRNSVQDKTNGTKVAFLENAVDRRHNFGVAN